MTQEFYDALAPWYHLIFEDWDRSMERQGGQLDALIRAEWRDVRRVLDAAAGIGTQAIPLARRGYDVTASDLSPSALERLGLEGRARGVSIKTVTADLRDLSGLSADFDLVIVCDNALPHLLSDDEITRALRQCRERLRPDGGLLISMRDYEPRDAGTIEKRPYGSRHTAEGDLVLYQVWEWDPPFYDVALTIVNEKADPACTPRVFRSRYYAISIDRVMDLARHAGFRAVRRIDGAFYQPVVVATA